MGVRFYDEALVNRIKSWTKDSNLKVLSPDEVTRLFEIKADESNDEPLVLPFVALSRDRNINIDIAHKTSMSFDGLHVKSNLQKTLQLNAVPISINYQLDIYTRSYEEGDEYLRNFIFFLINYPKLTINIPYNDSNIEYECYINLLNSVSDNSDIAERLFPGQFTRWTLNLSISKAYLFSVPINRNYSIDGSLEIKEISK